MISALTPVLPRPRHQLLLLLTKVPAAQSQGKEVVPVELVEDLLPQLLRKRVQTLEARDLLRPASFFGGLLNGSGARGRRSRSLRHPSSLRHAATVNTDARSLARSLSLGSLARLCRSFVSSLENPDGKNSTAPLLGAK